MSKTQEAVAMILRQLAQKVRKLSADDVDQILQGKLALSFEIRARKKREATTQPRADDLAVISKRMQNAQTREEGFRILKETCPAKRELIDLARFVDIPANPKERVQDLQQKLVEATIGYRLRSQAIRQRST